MYKGNKAPSGFNSRTGEKKLGGQSALSKWIVN